MPLIADYSTKKAFKSAVTETLGAVHVYDPSIFSPMSGNVADVVAAKGMITVTNHPKRSWFAMVKVVNGKLKVS